MKLENKCKKDEVYEVVKIKKSKFIFNFKHIYTKTQA